MSKYSRDIFRTWLFLWSVLLLKAEDIYIIHLGTESSAGTQEMHPEASIGYYSAQPSVDFAVSLLTADPNVLAGHTINVLYSDVTEVNDRVGSIDRTSHDCDTNKKLLH